MGTFLEILWKWLYTSYIPVETGTISIEKDKLIDELLDHPDAVGKFSEQLRPLYKSYVVRYLLAQYPSSPLRLVNFMDTKQTAFLLRAASEMETSVRRQQVPLFPEDLRAKLMGQLKEEMLGRRSASSLVSLSQSNQNNPPPSPSPANFEGTLSGPISTPLKNPAAKDTPASPATAPVARIPSDGSKSPHGSRQVSPNSITESNILKRSLTNSTAAAVQAAANSLSDRSDASGEVPSLPTESKRLRKTNHSTQPPQVISSAATPSASEQEGGGTGGSTGIFEPPWPHTQLVSAQQAANLPQEVALLRAWLIAMQKEVIELRTELQKRDRSYHRDMAGLRQEIDALRGEMAFQEFKSAQGKGAAAPVIVPQPKVAEKPQH